MPSRTHSSVQRTRSLPVHTPHTLLTFQQSGEPHTIFMIKINCVLKSFYLQLFFFYLLTLKIILNIYILGLAVSGTPDTI